MHQEYIITMLAAPCLSFILLGLFKLFRKELDPALAANWSLINFIFLTLVSIVGMAMLFQHGSQEVLFSGWLSLKGYVFDLRFLLNWQSVLFTFVCTFLFLTISLFSKTYLHGEESSFRFYLLLLLFAAGTYLVALSTSIDLIYAGWELVGISSVLLIGYFNRRSQPVGNALKVFRIYKLCDIALLSAAVWLHVFYHQASVTEVDHYSSVPLTIISLCIVFASLGKSAQFPFCNWLTLAIEGPTPSSTIFYGSISTHLGALLLIKTFPIISHSPQALAAIFILGGLSALYATIVGRVQADIKSSLAYSTVSQVGIIYMEIALGFTHVALVHILLHMCYRTYQFLWSPSIIDEHNLTEMEAGCQVLITGEHFKMLPASFRNHLYFLALNKFHLNSLWLRLLKVCGWGVDRILNWEALLAGKIEPFSEEVKKGHAWPNKLYNFLFSILSVAAAYYFYQYRGENFHEFFNRLQLLVSTLVTWLVLANLDEKDGKSLPLLSILLFAINVVFTLTTDIKLALLLWCLMPLPVYWQMRLYHKSSHSSFPYYQLIGVGLFCAGVYFGSSSGIVGGIFIVFALMIRQAEFPFHSWLLSIRDVKSLPLITQFLLFNSGVTLYLREYSSSLADYSTEMTVLTMISGLYLAILAWRSKNFVQKSILIVFSQSSLVLAGVESFENALGGSVIYMLAHALAGTCFLFVLCSVIKHKKIFEGGTFYGVGHKQWLHGFVFLLNGLVMVGCPLTLGFVGEDILFHTFLESYPLLGFSLIVLTALNGYNVLHLYSEIFLGPEKRNWSPFAFRKREISSFVMTFVIMIFLGLVPNLVIWNLDRVLKTESVAINHQKMP